MTSFQLTFPLKARRLPSTMSSTPSVMGPSNQRHMMKTNHSGLKLWPPMNESTGSLGGGMS